MTEQGADIFFADDYLSLFPHLEVETDPFGDLPAELTRAAGSASVKAARAESVKVQTRGTTREATQQGLWRNGEVFALSVAAKLREFGRLDLLEGFEDCHTSAMNARCTGCKKVNRFYNRCDLFYCPRCQPRLARERAESVEFWTKKVSQPKHVVLTMINTRELTKRHVQFIKESFQRLRDRKFARGWRGGFYRVEITNEGKGWHLHLHALIDADWIDSGKLAVQWNECNHGFGNIVKVQDCRKVDYLKEVTKYAVKGNMLAEWTGAEIAEFVDAFTGVKTFGTFGTLFKARAEWKEFCVGLAEKRAICACGCSSFTMHSDSELEWMELHVNSPVDRGVVPVALPRQLELGVIVRDVFNLFG